MTVKTAPRTTPTMAVHDATRGCTQPYTFAEVREVIERERKAGKSFREIARDVFGGQVTHAVVQRVHLGFEPREPRIRQALGLPAYHQVVVMMTGGDVPPGTQVITASICECGQYFISNHPARKRCFICSPYRRRHY